MTSSHHWKRLPDLFAAILCAGLLGAVLAGYPLGGHWLGGALLVYGAALLRWPHAWLLAVPAALPVLDLAPWTGRFFLDEFDALLAVTVLAHAWRERSVVPAPMSSLARAWLGLFGASTVLALLAGAWPLPVPGLNAFNHYYSPYNGLRLAKGLGWALLLWPLMRAALAADVVKTQRRFALGMGLGVVAAALAVAWERSAFTGILNFDNGYRVVGLFSGMHTGGCCIEAYFALSLPFLAWWTLTSRRWTGRLAGAAMLGAGSYALLVTYARAGYLAAALGMLVLALALHLRRRRPMAARHTLRATLMFALLALLAGIVAEGDAIQRRYADSERDLAARAGHWIDAIGIMDATPAAWLAGMGLGSYPRTYFLRSKESAPQSYLALQAEDGNTFLAIAAGAPLYFEQIVSLAPGRQYRLSFSARSRDGDARLVFPVCEKWMLYSRRCVRTGVAVGDTGGQWRRFSTSFASRPPLAPPARVERPVKLSLFSDAEGSMVDIDDLSLRDEGGRELLRNGGFGHGMDRWFFSTDNHLPWHLEHTWLQILFEQGLIGLAAFGGMVLCACAALVRRLRAGDSYAAALAGVLAAFLALSLLDSVFDFPRLGTLVFLILLNALYDGKKAILKRNIS